MQRTIPFFSTYFTSGEARIASRAAPTNIPLYPPKNSGQKWVMGLFSSSMEKENGRELIWLVVLTPSFNLTI
jgi:hypothetical protein